MNPRPTLLVIGATSDIARAVAHAFAAGGHDLILTARDPRQLERDAADLHHRHGASVTCLALDLLADDTTLANFAAGLNPLPTVVFCAVGLLGDPPRSLDDPDTTRQVMMSNFVGPAQMLTLLARRYRDSGSGTLIGVSSVAGDRGRGSNFAYGSAKAGFSAFLSGLRNHLHPHGVRVMTVKPGFVSTRMTAGLSLPPALTATPTQAAQDIYRAFLRQRDEVYTLWMWRWIMLIIRLLPESLFKRLRL
ncbi:MAG: SDR family oxidoreductase [Magnetococcus sp. WYHC-3]